MLEPCQHEGFEVFANVDKVEGSSVWWVNPQARCCGCGRVARFLGMDVGVLPNRPTVSIDHGEARLPFVLDLPPECWQWDWDGPESMPAQAAEAVWAALERGMPANAGPGFIMRPGTLEVDEALRGAVDRHLLEGEPDPAGRQPVGVLRWSECVGLIVEALNTSARMPMAERAEVVGDDGTTRVERMADELLQGVRTYLVPANAVDQALKIRDRQWSAQVGPAMALLSQVLDRGAVGELDRGKLEVARAHLDGSAEVPGAPS